MVSSGTFNWDLDNADCVLEAFDRCGIRPPAITGDMMISARRSINLELQRWGNIGPNLWAIDLQTINLLPGVSTYSLDIETVNVLDVYLRTFTLTNVFNLTPNFSTTINSPVVTINIPNHGLMSGMWINVVTPVAIGGIVVSGMYEVTSILSVNSFTVTIAQNATSSVSNSGAVPVFTTTGGSTTANVNLANHGYVQGELFNVGVQTAVGGITLYGAYTISSVTDVNNFRIQTMQTAASNASLGENNGQVQVQGQSLSVDPIDRIMTPMGRTDYAQLPDKFVQGWPNQYWVNRQINPTITVWQVPDNNGPYQVAYYRMRRLQDANASMGDTPDIPYRFLDALCARLAARLAVKYATDKLEMLAADAKATWDEAATEDRERADIYIRPDFSGFYRD